MTCQEFNDLLFDYTDRNLHSNQKKAVETHLQHCNKCKAAFHRYKNIIQKLNRLPNLECPDKVVEKVFNSIPKEKVKVQLLTEMFNTVSNRFSGKIRFAVSAAVVIFLIFVFYPQYENQEFVGQIYTTEEIEQASKDVELALGYINYYAAKTESAFENYVIQKSIIEPINLTIKKSFKSLLNGG